MNMKDLHHDAEPGPLTRCQISGSQYSFSALDLGAQPLCDALLATREQPEVVYPLELRIYPQSGLGQLSYGVSQEEVYPADYPYRAGISKPLVEYQQAFAQNVIRRGFTTLPNPLVVDVGSNDGTLLKGFKVAGWRALGVEPTDIAVLAQADGIYTLQEPFTESVAKDIVVEYGRATVVTMSNAFAHMLGLGEVMRGLVTLLARDGVFVTETHYLLDVLEANQFDTVYHEHVRTYSLKSLCMLMEQYGLQVFDVERGERYGGNIRVYVARQGQRSVTPAVVELLHWEEERGLFHEQTWVQWANRCRAQRRLMMNWLFNMQLEGRQVAGCSAPGRASTLLNWYGVTPDLMSFTGELHNSLKLGKYLPGCRIPVVPNTLLHDKNIDSIVLLAWHYAGAIATRLRAEGVTAKLYVPLPLFVQVGR